MVMEAEPWRRTSDFGRAGTTGTVALLQTALVPALPCPLHVARVPGRFLLGGWHGKDYGSPVRLRGIG